MNLLKKKIISSVLLTGLLLAGMPAVCGEPTEAESTLTKVGQAAPVFEATTLEGVKFDLKALKGKVVVVNFFATWCGPCMQEMPRLEKDVWQKFKGKNFTLIAIGREHSEKELAEFQKTKAFTFPIAPDPKRGIYGQYAKQYIPRNYVINGEGKIIFQSMGYNEAEFSKMIEVIEKEIGKPAGT